MESSLYVTLHRFLLEKNLEKTAKALLRETKATLETGTPSSFDLVAVFSTHFEREEKEKKEKEKEEKEKKEKEEKEKEEAKKKEKKSKKRSRSESEVASEEPQKKRRKSEEKKEKKEKKKEKKEKKEKKKDKKKEEEPKEEEEKEEEKKEEEEEKEENSEMVEEDTGDYDDQKKTKKAITPFRRIKEEEIHIERAELRDNTYYAKYEKGGDSWGFKANKDLEKTRGKGFRHEKTKKKRGTYKGGIIDKNHVASIKFEYSDDED